MASYYSGEGIFTKLVDDSNGLITSVNPLATILTAKNEEGTYGNVNRTNDGELFTNTKASNRQTQALYNAGTIAADTYAILVDLSEETYTAYTSVDELAITCRFSTNNSDANVKVGVITRVDATDADISYLIDVPFSAANSNTYLDYIVNYQPSSLKFEMSGGSLVGAYTNETSAAVAAVNTSTTLPSPRGNVTPAVGDLIMLFDHTGGNFSSVVHAVYHTD